MISPGESQGMATVDAVLHDVDEIIYLQATSLANSEQRLFLGGTALADKKQDPQPKRWPVQTICRLRSYMQAFGPPRLSFSHRWSHPIIERRISFPDIVGGLLVGMDAILIRCTAGF